MAEATQRRCRSLKGLRRITQSSQGRPPITCSSRMRLIRSGVTPPYQIPSGQISSTGSARSTTTPPSETCSGWGLGLGSCQPGRRVAGPWQTRSAKPSGQRPLRLQWPLAARLPGHKLAPTPSTTAADAHGHLVSAEQPSQCRVVARALDGQLARHWLRVEEPVGVELGDARVHVHLQCGTEARITVVAAR